MDKQNKFQNLRSFFTNCLLILGSMLVFAFISEGAARGYREWESRGRIVPGYSKPDSVLGYKLQEGLEARNYSRGEFDVVEQTNLVGFRAIREYGGKPKGIKRILVIGDSFAFGPGVQFENIFSQQLERLFQDGETNFSFEVINAAVPGYDTWQEWQWLERIGPAIDPDLILLGLFIGNDISQNALRIQSNLEVINEKEKGYYSPDSHRMRFPFPFKQFLAEHSAAFKFFRERYHQLLRMIKVREKPTEESVWWLDLYRKDLPDFESLGYVATENLLMNIKGWADGHDAGLVLMLIPELGQVWPQHWEQTIGDKIVFDINAYDLSKPNRWLIDYGSRIGVPVIDLLPHFKVAERPETLYFKKDTHWSPYGHQVAAEKAAQFFITEGLRKKKKTGLSPTGRRSQH